MRYGDERVDRGEVCRSGYGRRVEQSPPHSGAQKRSVGGAASGGRCEAFSISFCFTFSFVSFQSTDLRGRRQKQKKNDAPNPRKQKNTPGRQDGGRQK